MERMRCHAPSRSTCLVRSRVVLGTHDAYGARSLLSFYESELGPQEREDSLRPFQISAPPRVDACLSGRFYTAHSENCSLESNQYRGDPGASALRHTDLEVAITAAPGIAARHRRALSIEEAGCPRQREWFDPPKVAAATSVVHQLTIEHQFAIDQATRTRIAPRSAKD